MIAYESLSPWFQRKEATRVGVIESGRSKPDTLVAIIGNLGFALGEKALHVRLISECRIPSKRYRSATVAA